MAHQHLWVGQQKEWTQTSQPALLTSKWLMRPAGRRTKTAATLGYAMYFPLKQKGPWTPAQRRVAQREQLPRFRVPLQRRCRFLEAVGASAVTSGCGVEGGLLPHQHSRHGATRAAVGGPRRWRQKCRRRCLPCSDLCKPGASTARHRLHVHSPHPAQHVQCAPRRWSPCICGVRVACTVQQHCGLSPPEAGTDPSMEG